MPNKADEGGPDTLSATDTAVGVPDVATDAPQTPPEAVGAGRYQLGSSIGRGGSGEVFRAHDTVLERAVAIKLFPAGSAVAEQARLWREIRTLAGLNHCGLVSVYDVGKDRGRPYFVMQLVEGLSLAARLTVGPLPLGRTVDLGRALAGGLDHVHRRGVVHRDLKPANVLLDRTGRPYLTDFGEAARHGASAITVDGLVSGTAPYLAPEQVRGQPVGPAADVYSLALVLLECLSGLREYPGDAVSAATARLAHPPQIPADLPDSLATVLRSMTDPRPGRRPDADTLGDYFAALHGSVAGDETAPQPGGLRTRPRRGVPNPGRCAAASGTATAAVGAATGVPGPNLAAGRSTRRRRRVTRSAVLALVLALGAGAVGVLRSADPLPDPMTSAVVAGPATPTRPVPTPAPSSGEGASSPAHDGAPAEHRITAVHRAVSGDTENDTRSGVRVRAERAADLRPASSKGAPAPVASLTTRKPDHKYGRGAAPEAGKRRADDSPKNEGRRRDTVHAADPDEEDGESEAKSDGANVVVGLALDRRNGRESERTSEISGEHGLTLGDPQ